MSSLDIKNKDMIFKRVDLSGGLSVRIFVRLSASWKVIAWRNACFPDDQLVGFGLIFFIFFFSFFFFSFFSSPSSTFLIEGVLGSKTYFAKVS